MVRVGLGNLTTTRLAWFLSHGQCCCFCLQLILQDIRIFERTRFTLVVYKNPEILLWIYVCTAPSVRNTKGAVGDKIQARELETAEGRK